MTGRMTIPYEDMMHEALLGVVRQSLQYVQGRGLPGDHHFYIGFRTDHPQVVISEQLKQRYPYEMTIVLQYQFWDLDVRHDGFSVAVNFNNVPHTLHIPFGALTSFVDPSVHFRLQFNPKFEPTNSASKTQEPEAQPTPLKKPTPEQKTSDMKSEDGKVVSLDAFRKK